MTAPRFRTVLGIIVILVALVGLAESTYLTVLNLTGETAVCGGSSDCFRVLGSSYARIGPIPLAGLGALGYFGVFTFAVFSIFGYARARLFLALNIWAMFLVTLWLLCVQAFILHAFCRYCLFSAALIFFLTGIVLVTPPEQKVGNPA